MSPPRQIVWVVIEDYALRHLVMQQLRQAGFGVGENYKEGDASLLLDKTGYAPVAVVTDFFEDTRPPRGELVDKCLARQIGVVVMPDAPFDEPEKKGALAHIGKRVGQCIIAKTQFKDDPAAIITAVRQLAARGPARL